VDSGCYINQNFTTFPRVLYSCTVSQFAQIFHLVSKRAGSAPSEKRILLTLAQTEAELRMHSANNYANNWLIHWAHRSIQQIP